nr:lysophospholipid acyltransferase family protein [Planococcus glaciei]
MIKAKKMPLFENAFELYLNPLIRRSFANVFGRDIVQPPSQPVLFIANHSSWWDGLLFFFLNRSVWRHDVHMMMDEKGLKRYGFFRYLGAFSINRSKPKDILASLQYAEQLLLSGKTVILFPQGEEFHQEIRPLGFSTGIAYLMEHCPDVPAIPVSFLLFVPARTQTGSMGATRQTFLLCRNRGRSKKREKPPPLNKPLQNSLIS